MPTPYYLDMSRSFKSNESFIFRYFKVFQVSQMFTYALSDLLLLVVFVLREYILKVHVLVSSEHKLCHNWNTYIMSYIYWSIAFLSKLFHEAYYQESYILIIEYSSVVIVAVFNYLESDTNATAGYVFYKWCLHFDMEIVVVLLLILVFNRFTHIFEFCALRELEIRIQHSVPNYW